MSRGRQPTEGDNSGLMVMAAVLAMLGMLWLIAHEQISWVVMTVRLWEARLLSFDTEGQRMVYQWIASRHPRDATINELWQSGQVTGYYLRWIVIAILLPLFAWMFMKHPGRSLQFNRRFGILSLARSQTGLYPAMAPMLDMDLLNTSIDDPIHGMRMRPRDYAKRYGMVKPMVEIATDHPRDDLDVVDARTVILLKRSREVFAKQLGAEWRGIGHEQLPAYERALLVAFATQAAALDDKANDLSEKITNELAAGAVQAFKTGDATKIVSKTADAMQDAVMAAPAVQRVLRRHGFRRTVLMGMLEEARKGGVLNPARFRWLKAVDRVTWYCLTDMGMHPSSVESAGVRAQYQIEVAANGPVLTPMIESAVNGLRMYLDEVSEDDKAS